jgi:hypothetical protein
MLARLALLTALLLAFAAAAAAATSPADLYRSAIAAASAKQSVHYVSVSKLGANAETMVGDATLDRGIQRITFTQGGTTGHVTVVVVKAVAYVRGDAFTLINYMGLSSAQASRYDGRWFSLKPPSGAYGVVAEAVRMGSFLSELQMPGPYTAAPAATFAGHRVTGVRTKVTRSGKSAVLTLYVAAGTQLPVAQVIGGGNGTITTTLGRWNERVTIAAPHGAVAFH